MSYLDKDVPVFKVELSEPYSMMIYSKISHPHHIYDDNSILNEHYWAVRFDKLIVSLEWMELGIFLSNIIFTQDLAI